MRGPTVVLTGAGLSTASGIPDYRSDGGVWERFDQNEFHISRWHADPVRFWDQRVHLTREMGILNARPNRAHHILHEAIMAGQVSMIITQNIDGLQQRAGTPADRLIEVHGNAALCRCLDCDATTPTPDVVAGHVPGEAPRCPCGGVWKPDVVLFGEMVDEMPRAEAAVAQAGTLVTAGTSLQVFPVAGLVSTAHHAGADIVIVNRDPTPFDGHATEVVRGDLIDGLDRLFGTPPPE